MKIEAKEVVGMNIKIEEENAEVDVKIWIEDKEVNEKIQIQNVEEVMNVNKINKWRRNIKW